MSSSEKVLWSLLDCLRGHIAFDTFSAFEFALQLLAWVKLSVEGKIPSDLRFSRKVKALTGQELYNLFVSLSSDEILKENSSAFQPSSWGRAELSDSAIGIVLNLLDEIAQSGVLQKFELHEDIYLKLGQGAGILFVPSEVTDLMIEMAGDLANKETYCLNDTPCLFAKKTFRKGATVCAESHMFSSQPWLMNILNNTDIEIAVGDPIRQPNFTANGKLKKFDLVIGFPPMGVKYNLEVVQQDWFDRFPEETTSGSVLNVYHAISQARGRVILAVSNSILFGRGAEHSLRKNLLEKGMIEAVIAMPPALLSLTPISFSIIVLDAKGKSKSVRFMDGSDQSFFERDGKNRSKLIGWKELIKTFQARKNEALVRDVSVDEILGNDAHLEVSRYLLPPEQKEVNQVLGNAKTALLEELVEFIRPSAKLGKNGNFECFEASTTDFPEFGYLSQPERSILISEESLSAKERKTFLRPRDILMATKGSVGKLAIVPDIVPEVGKGGWLVNQSCLILRPTGEINPKVLFMYLRSDIGQTLIRGIVSGASIPLIQLRSLQNLEIIIPPAQEALDIIASFDELVELQQQISLFREKQSRISKLHWGL